MEIKRITSGQWNQHSYVLVKNNGNAVMVDPAALSKEVLEELHQKVKIKAILLTHAHYDHVSSVDVLKRMTNAVTVLHENDYKLLTKANTYRILFGEKEKIQTPEIDIFLHGEKGAIKIDDFLLQWKLYPGHTEGSCIYQWDQWIFSGDLIFEKDWGRTDLPGGNQEKMKKSKDSFLKLSQDSIIYPGHGKSFLLGQRQKRVLEAEITG